MKHNSLKTTQKRKFISPNVGIFVCASGAEILAGSLQESTLENVEEINNYFEN